VHLHSPPTILLTKKFKQMQEKVLFNLIITKYCKKILSKGFSLLSSYSFNALHTIYPSPPFFSTTLLFSISSLLSYFYLIWYLFFSFSLSLPFLLSLFMHSNSQSEVREETGRKERKGGDRKESKERKGEWQGSEGKDMEKRGKSRAEFKKR
jgi:hypothetical protein